MAAHLVTVELCEQMATLREGMGHLEKAAEVRARAEQARELHRAAEGELEKYLARIKAIEDRRARHRRDGMGPG